MEGRSANQHALCFPHRPECVVISRGAMESPSKDRGTPGENGQPDNQDNGRFPFKRDCERQSDKDDEEDELLIDANRSPPSDVVQPGVRFIQQRHQHWKKSGVFVDGVNYQHHHIKPLVRSPQLQPHHRLSRNSLLGSCKSIDFCYEDERYT